MSDQVEDTAGENPSRPLRDARKDALRRLSRRPLTDAEIRTRLAERGHAAPVIEQTVAALHESGLLNDEVLAVHYIVTRSARLGHGRSRLLRELERRGVARGVAERAWREAVELDEVDPDDVLRRQVARQVDRCAGRLEPRDYRRVYNALLRGGHDAGAVVAALRPHRCYPDSDEA